MRMIVKMTEKGKCPNIKKNMLFSLIRHHQFSTFAKFSKNLAFLIPP